MLLVNLKIEGCSRILSSKLTAGLTSKTVAVRSIWVTRRLDCSASLELPLILPNEIYLGPPPHILPTIQKAPSYSWIQSSFIKLWIYNSFTNMYMYIRSQFFQFLQYILLMSFASLK